MLKRILSIVLIIAMFSLLAVPSVFAVESIEVSKLQKTEIIHSINMSGKIFHIEKHLNKIYLKNIQTNEKIFIASIEIEGLFKRKNSTLLRASYSWTSEIEHKYSIKLEDTIYRLGWANELIATVIFQPLGMGAALLATIAHKFIKDAFVDYLKRTQPAMLYVTVRYKEQLGCPFRRYYIATDLYLNSERTIKWNSIPLNEEIFTGDKNDFTLPAVCRL